MTATPTIRVWGNDGYVFIDLSGYEIRRFPRARYPNTLAGEVAYHVNRLLYVTGAETFVNETDLDL